MRLSRPSSKLGLTCLKYKMMQKGLKNPKISSILSNERKGLVDLTYIQIQSEFNVEGLNKTEEREYRP